jgi:hypothetical protein
MRATLENLGHSKKNMQMVKSTQQGMRKFTSVNKNKA